MRLVRDQQRQILRQDSIKLEHTASPTDMDEGRAREPLVSNVV